MLTVRLSTRHDAAVQTDERTSRRASYRQLGGYPLVVALTIAFSISSLRCINAMAYSRGSSG
jgi:hypothetical protein